MIDTFDGASYVWGIVLASLVMFPLGYAWGRFHAAVRARWMIDIRALEGGVEIRRIASRKI